MRLLDCRWFNDVGIVRVSTQYDGVRYYIKAVVNPTTEAQDARMIAELGVSFPTAVGDMLFGVRRTATEDIWEDYDEFH